MLNRVVLLGGDEKKRAKLAKELGEGFDVVSAEAPTALPCQTVGLVAATAAASIAGGLEVLARRGEALLTLIGESIDCREGLVAGSSLRMLEHATRFAQALGLGPDDRLRLERGTLLHDLGKLRVSNAVLLTKALLTHDEWEALRQHTTLGAAMCKTTDGLQDIADIVEYHHENYDGTGYPRGLEGEAIPHLARAAKLIDVYCAMTSPRIYRAGHATHEQACAHLEAECGRHFDPEMARLFLDKQVGRTGDGRE